MTSVRLSPLRAKHPPSHSIVDELKTHPTTRSDDHTIGESLPLESRSTAASAVSTVMRQSARQGHGRSISHPFPSLFGAGKKQERESNKGSGPDPLESTDDEGIMDDEGLMPNSSPVRSGSQYRKAVERDSTSGRCMTCDSMVRWPKELTVFRCTICLTINDLQPKAQDGPDSRAPWGAYGGTKEPATAAPIPTKGRESSVLVHHSVLADRSPSIASVHREDSSHY